MQIIDIAGVTMLHGTTVAADRSPQLVMAACPGRHGALPPTRPRLEPMRIAAKFLIEPTATATLEQVLAAFQTVTHHPGGLSATKPFPTPHSGVVSATTKLWLESFTVDESLPNRWIRATCIFVAPTGTWKAPTAPRLLEAVATMVTLPVGTAPSNDLTFRCPASVEKLEVVNPANGTGIIAARPTVNRWWWISVSELLVWYSTIDNAWIIPPAASRQYNVDYPQAGPLETYPDRDNTCRLEVTVTGTGAIYVAAPHLFM